MPGRISPNPAEERWGARATEREWTSPREGGQSFLRALCAPMANSPDTWERVSPCHRLSAAIFRGPTIGVSFFRLPVALQGFWFLRSNTTQIPRSLECPYLFQIGSQMSDSPSERRLLRVLGFNILTDLSGDGRFACASRVGHR